MFPQLKVDGDVSHERSLLRVVEVVAHVRDERSSTSIRFDVEERNSIFLRQFFRVARRREEKLGSSDLSRRIPL